MNFYFEQTSLMVVNFDFTHPTMLKFIVKSSKQFYCTNKNIMVRNLSEIVHKEVNWEVKPKKYLDNDSYYALSMEKNEKKGKYCAIIQNYNQMQYHNCNMGVSEFNKVLQAFLITKNYDKFEHTYKSFIENKLKPDCQTHSLLISYYVLKDQADEIMRIYEETKDLYIKNPQYHEPIFIYYSLKNDFENCLKLYKYITEDKKSEVTLKSISHMLEALINTKNYTNEMYEEGYKIWKKYHEVDYEEFLFPGLKILYNLKKYSEIQNELKIILKFHSYCIQYRYLRYFILTSIRTEDYKLTQEYIDILQSDLPQPKRNVKIEREDFFMYTFPLLYIFYMKTQQMDKIMEISNVNRKLKGITAQIATAIIMFPSSYGYSLFMSFPNGFYERAELSTALNHIYCCGYYQNILDAYNILKETRYKRWFLKSPIFIQTLLKFDYSSIMDIVKEIGEAHETRKYPDYVNHYVLAVLLYQNKVYIPAIINWGYSHSMNQVLKLELDNYIDKNILLKCIEAGDKKRLLDLCIPFNEVNNLRYFVYKIALIMKNVFHDKERHKELRKMLENKSIIVSNKYDMSMFYNAKIKENRVVEWDELFPDLKNMVYLHKFPHYEPLSIFEQ